MNGCRRGRGKEERVRSKREWIRNGIKRRRRSEEIGKGGKASARKKE